MQPYKHDLRISADAPDGIGEQLPLRSPSPEGLYYSGTSVPHDDALSRSLSPQRLAFWDKELFADVDHDSGRKGRAVFRGHGVHHSLPSTPQKYHSDTVTSRLRFTLNDERMFRHRYKVIFSATLAVHVLVSTCWHICALTRMNGCPRHQRSVPDPALTTLARRSDEHN